MLRALDSQLEGCGFDSRPFHFQVTTLGKLFTYTCASAIKQYKSVQSKGDE